MPTSTDARRLLRLARRASDQAHAQRLLAAAYVTEAVALGATWAEVGAAFDVSRQAAHERFSPANRRRRRVTPDSGAALSEVTNPEEASDEPR